MNILSIDIGTTTGWALATSDGKVRGGSVKMAPTRMEGPGARWLKFRAFLAESQRSVDQIHVVYYERVLRHTAVQAAHVYGGFEAMLQVWCESNRVRMVAVPVPVIKKSWTGKGNADKVAMVAMAKSRGFNPVDDNHADALALLAYALGIERMPEPDHPLMEPPAAPLFEEVEA